MTKDQVDMLFNVHMRLVRLEDDHVRLVGEYNNSQALLDNLNRNNATLVTLFNKVSERIEVIAHAIEQKRQENQSSNAKDLRKEERGASVLQVREQGHDQESYEKDALKRQEREERIIAQVKKSVGVRTNVSDAVEDSKKLERGQPYPSPRYA